MEWGRLRSGNDTKSTHRSTYLQGKPHPKNALPLNPSLFEDNPDEVLWGPTFLGLHSVSSNGNSARSSTFTRSKGPSTLSNVPSEYPLFNQRSVCYRASAPVVPSLGSSASITPEPANKAATPTTPCRTNPLGRSRHPEGFRRRRKQNSTERDEHFTNIQFSWRFDKNYRIPPRVKFCPNSSWKGAIPPNVATMFTSDWWVAITKDSTGKSSALQPLTQR